MITEEINVAKSRFRSAPFFEEANTLEVFVGGAGGIGSWLILYLSRIVNRIHVYDYDKVEKVNLAGQLFKYSDVGNTKVGAIGLTAREYGDAQINTYPFKLEPITEVPEAFVFSAFDNMTARKDLFEIWKANDKRKLFIDARLLADQYEVYFVQKGMEEAYEATLFSDEEVEEVACTFKQTTHFAAICAGRMIHGFTNYLSQHMLYKMPFKVVEEGNLFLNEVSYAD